MSYLPEAVRSELKEARYAMLRRKARLCVLAGRRVFRVTRRWDGGFAILATDAPILHGFVDLYDGSRHICQCLVVASHEEAGEQIFEFKWTTPVASRPPLDFEVADVRPVALIGTGA